MRTWKSENIKPHLAHTGFNIQTLDFKHNFWFTVELFKQTVTLQSPDRSCCVATNWWNQKGSEAEVWIFRCFVQSGHLMWSKCICLYLMRNSWTCFIFFSFCLSTRYDTGLKCNSQHYGLKYHRCKQKWNFKWAEKISSDLCEGHPVGMFPDLSQPKTLLHLSIPWEKEQNSGEIIFFTHFVDGVLNMAMPVI